LTAALETLDLLRCRITVRVAGRGRRTALLVHGLGDDHTAFPTALVRDLARDHRVLVPDLAGFGASRARPDFPFTIEAQAELLEALLAAGQVSGPVLLLGHSMGGALATHLAERLALPVIALINVEGNLVPSDTFISSHAVRSAARGRFEHWWRFFPAAIRRRGGDSPSVDRYLAALARTTPEAFLATCRDLRRRTVDGAFAEAFRRLAVPRLYCFGDDPPPETRAFLVRHRLSHAHFPGAPHWLIEHDPDAFHERLRAFLAAGR
jgi:pimeloyl-ACP methyl ester carboxylesterase